MRILLIIALSLAVGCDRPTHYAEPFPPYTSSGDETYYRRLEEIERLNREIDNGTHTYQPSKDIWRQY